MKSQLDLFEAAAAAIPAPTRPRAPVRRKPSNPISDEDMARHLEETGQYRILRRLIPRPIVAEPRPGFPRVGIVIDTETTGLKRPAAEVIEVGAVAFTFDDDGRFGDVIGVYGGLQQPSKPIPAEIAALTGITDDMVAGQSLDLDALRNLIAPADLIIAHNAGFDRPFCEGLVSDFAGKAWACSVAEIDWKSRGFEGTKLGYLVGQSGYFHDGHRAVDDCFALLEILVAAGEGESPLVELHRSSRRSLARIWAEYSPFDMKDKLKARGYRWSDGTDGRAKAWWGEVDADAVDAELAWLRTEVYHRADIDPPVQHLTAFDRYKA
jgi:DNA polymerase-3 subunit epsilon